MAANKNFRITADGRVFRQGRKRYPAGDLYVGEFVDGLREGRGTLEYTNGNRYIGEWKANVYHGFGCFVWNAYAEGKLVIKGRRYELREQHYWCVCVALLAAVWLCVLSAGWLFFVALLWGAPGSRGTSKRARCPGGASSCAGKATVTRGVLRTTSTRGKAP